MRIVIDLGHPAHVHYFKNFIEIMKSKGHDFLIAARDKDVTHKLLSSYGIKYKSRGRGRNKLIGKAIYSNELPRSKLRGSSLKLKKLYYSAIFHGVPGMISARKGFQMMLN